MKILDKLEKLQDSGKSVLLKWYYEEEDEDMLEEAEEFESIANIEFEIIPISYADSYIEDDLFELFNLS